ncbi:MAG: hypothetical protein NC921_01695, partial [Candidatus Omnitrophica bacterium]|nr:hypothetical protein [Candidatus Omnitrophota bacterium]
ISSRFGFFPVLGRFFWQIDTNSSFLIFLIEDAEGKSLRIDMISNKFSLQKNLFSPTSNIKIVIKEDYFH